MQLGFLNRSNGQTDVNQHRARWKLIVPVTVTCENVDTGSKPCGNFHLVDLADAKSDSSSNESVDRLKDAQLIINSLSGRGDLSTASTGSSTQESYSNSELGNLF